MTQEMSKEKCNKWLNEAEISTPGSKEELNKRIIKFRRHPRQNLWKNSKQELKKHISLSAVKI